MKSGKTNAPQLPAPSHLSPRSAALWQEVVADRCDSLERQVLLQLALEDMDPADKLRAQIEAEGLTQTSARNKLVRAHPALKIETEARRRFLRAWDMLNLRAVADQVA